MRRTPIKALRTFAADVRALGAVAAIKLLCAWVATIFKKDFGIRIGPRILKLRLRGSTYSLSIRSASSDLYVVRQIFVDREYTPASNLQNVRLIVDCGANIGCSAIYFLLQYPGAKVIAIEPDQANHAMLCRNLAPFGERAIILRAAVWSDEQQRLVVDGNLVDGLEWAVTVKAAKTGVDAIQAVTIRGLLDRSGYQRIDLLKIDVEGAEREIFSGDCRNWLSATDNLCIELHGDDCRAIFARALKEFEFDSEISGELTICRNIRELEATLKPNPQTANRPQQNN